MGGGVVVAEVEVVEVVELELEIGIEMEIEVEIVESVEVALPLAEGLALVFGFPLRESLRGSQTRRASAPQLSENPTRAETAVTVEASLRLGVMTAPKIHSSPAWLLQESEEATCEVDIPPPWEAGTPLSRLWSELGMEALEEVAV